ncbi:hypothetical protein K439DRAFT_1614790 [Ramaria rubella]|nr:hypothetical protein K439DRAFT_1614790 [Ramaria rubella]
MVPIASTYTFATVLLSASLIHGANINALRRQTSSATPVSSTPTLPTDIPSQCQGECAPPMATLKSCNPPVASCLCLESFTTGLFECFSCIGQSVNATDYSVPQMDVDGVTSACDNAGHPLPGLTFPGQDANRPLATSSAGGSAGAGAGASSSAVGSPGATGTHGASSISVGAESTSVSGGVASGVASGSASVSTGSVGVGTGGVSTTGAGVGSASGAGTGTAPTSNPSQTAPASSSGVSTGASTSAAGAPTTTPKPSAARGGNEGMGIAVCVWMAIAVVLGGMIF